MSATRDKSQKFQFVYSNLYSIYKKGKEAAKEAAVADTAISANPAGFGLTTSNRVLKSGDAHAASVSTVSPVAPPRISEYSPMELIGKRVNRPEILPPVE